MEKENKSVIANVIVDLYEMRASCIKPVSFREQQDLHELHKYNFFNIVIASLIDKYNIKHDEIYKAIQERVITKEFPKE